MMEQIQGYFILSAIFLLLFLGAASLVEKYKSVIPLKVSWDTLTNIFSIWFFIICFRKMIYYVPFFGIMQTESTLWWVDKNVLFFLYYLLFLFLYGSVLIAVGIGAIAGKIKSITGMFLTFLFFVLLMACVRVLENLGLEFGIGEVLYMLVFSPLLFLKMLCSGKYLGLLTSLVVAYFIVDTYKELKPKITRNNAISLAPFGFLFWVFLVFSFTYFPLDWEEKLLHQLQTAKNRGDFLEVLDTTKSMKNLRDESHALKRIAMEIARTGEIKRAKLVAEQIPDEEIKNKTLEEIRGKIRKK